MVDAAIKAVGLSKQYVVGRAEKTYNTFYDLLAHTLSAPFRALRGLAGRDDEAETFLALDDVSFEVQPGDVVGIIGRNGAGKSTLLKILSRITAPSKGRVEVRGRLASLLEVGTGFHPELSGRENILLNGAILGMTRREVAAKFDEIVAFAEVDRFIDTPVKRYSSGMYVRLAFAVAAHLDADILLVDEVLAVGDAAFQRKCLGAMSDVSRSGRTVIFVSHNMGAIRNLCQQVLLLESGSVRFLGPVEEGVAIYEGALSSIGGALVASQFRGPLANQLKFHELVCMQAGTATSIVDPLQDFEVHLHGTALCALPSLELSIEIFRDGLHLASCHDTPEEAIMKEGRFTSKFRIPAQVMRPGRYSIGIGASGPSGWVLGSEVSILEFSENWGGRSAVYNRGAVALPYQAERIQ